MHDNHVSVERRVFWWPVVYLANSDKVWKGFADLVEMLPMDHCISSEEREVVLVSQDIYIEQVNTPVDKFMEAGMFSTVDADLGLRVGRFRIEIGIAVRRQNQCARIQPALNNLEGPHRDIVQGNSPIFCLSKFSLEGALEIRRYLAK